MDLFKLLGTVSIKNDEANKALDETSGKGEKAESKLGKAFGAIGSGAVAVGKAVGTGMVVAGAAVAGLVTKSIQAYADYEQLVGGVETLFGAGGQSIEEYAASVGKSVEKCKEEYDKLMRSQSAVMENAKEAYKTAGLSANEYMETVTSFSASLLQSLGGDTEKAAEVADRAIIDMSDNANKMGTSMELIQNAYNGFAKGNFTMLDNLKLGYGGTQEEMKRLIKDAAKMKDVQKELGITVDANSMSFGNIVNAISVMQKKMGIAGTTAKEASATISGSLGMMKAAWQNVMTGMADDSADFDGYITAFVDSVGAVAENLMPRIEIALNGVVKLIDKLAPVIMAKIPELLNTLLPSIVSGATNLIQSLVDIIPGLVSTLTTLLPEVVNGFISIIEGLFNGIYEVAWDAAPQLISGIAEAFESLIDILPLILSRIVDSLVGLAPSLITGIMSVVSTLAAELPNILSVLIESVPWLLEEIAKALLDNLPMLINGITTMLSGIVDLLPWAVNALVNTVVLILTMLVEQLPVILPTLIQAIMSLLTMLLEQIPVLLPIIVQAVMTIINLLVEQLPVLIPMIIDAVIQIVYLLIEQLPIIMPMLIEACITIILALIEALPTVLHPLINALPGLLQAIWDAIVMIFENLPQWFGQIFQGAWDAICAIFEPLSGWFEENFGDAWDSIVIIWDAVKPYFQGIWEGIKGVFSIVKDFFVMHFKNAWEGIKLTFSVAVDYFKTVWANIKQVFSVVKNVLTGNFGDAWEGIKKIFSNWGAFWSGLWDKVKNTFSKIGTNIGEAISGSVKAGINGLLGMIEGTINTGVNLINGAINLINKIPGVSIGKIKKVEFPRLAEGGVVDKPTFAQIGEDGAELLDGNTVIPLENNTGWISKVAKQLHEFTLNTKNDLAGMLSHRSVELQEQQVSELKNMNNKIDRIIGLLVQFFPEVIEAMKTPMVLDPDGAAVALAAPMDRELGKLAIQKGRGR